MITLVTVRNNAPNVSVGVEQCLVDYVRYYGRIDCLDRWAHELGITPWYVRRCAHSAAAKGLVKLTRLEDVSGRPYQVTEGEETP